VHELLRRLIGADDLEVLIDEDVVWPVDADVVDLVFAIPQLHYTVDDSSRIRREGCFRRLIGCRSADDRPRSLAVTGGDLTGLLCRFGCTSLKGTTVAAVDGSDATPLVCTSTCVALMVVELTVPRTRTVSPLAIVLFEAEFVPLLVFAEDSSSTVTS
jgi:hypothetical protein